MSIKYIKYFNYIKYFYTSGHERSVKAKKNIIASFGLKGISIIIGLLLVPMTITYVGTINFGIWLTLISVIEWFNFFDIGLGNGLRNKFAEALAKDQKELARTYVSTTYAILLIIVGIVYLLFIIINPLINWTKILNTSPQMGVELSKLVFIVFTFFCARFIVKLIGTIIVADQKPALNDSFNIISNIFVLIIIFILTKTTTGSLIRLGFVISITPVIILTIASLLFYSSSYRYCRPSYKYVQVKYFNELASLGIKFFIIQIAAVMLFSTSNIIISQLFGPENVTPYYIAYKYFMIISMIFTIITTPFWSASTEAYIKKDYYWIKKFVNKLIKIWAILSIILVIMIIFSNQFYLLWIGSKVKVPFDLSLIMGFFVIINTFSFIYVNFINGVGKIRLQLYFSIFETISFIPLAIFFCKIFGISGVIFARVLAFLPGTIIIYIQYRKIITNTANKIWIK
jgi:O-antigen/teichoic acid export membrane protein